MLSQLSEESEMMDNSKEKAKSEFPIGREAIALKILGEYWLDFFGLN